MALVHVSSSRSPVDVGGNLRAVRRGVSPRCFTRVIQDSKRCAMAARWNRLCLTRGRASRDAGVTGGTGGGGNIPDGNIPERSDAMYNIFYIIGVIVVILAILGYLGLR
jgi:hypothetical protein